VASTDILMGRAGRPWESAQTAAETHAKIQSASLRQPRLLIRRPPFARWSEEASPGQFSHELDIAWPPSSEVRIEAAVVCRGCDGSAQVCRRLSKVRVIESVKEAGPELKTKPFGNSERPLHRDVPGIQAGGNDGVARAVSEGSGSG